MLSACLQSQTSLTNSEQDYVKDAAQQLHAICHRYLSSITESALPLWATSFVGQMLVEAIAGSMPLLSSCQASKLPPCCSGMAIASLMLPCLVGQPALLLCVAVHC